MTLNYGKIAQEAASGPGKEPKMSMEQLWSDERIRQQIKDNGGNGEIYSDSSPQSRCVFTGFAIQDAIRIRDEYEQHRGWMDVEIDRLRALLPDEKTLDAITTLCVRFPDPRLHDAADDVNAWLERLEGEVSNE